MEVVLWSILLGFAILVTAFVVSLYYRRKYDPIFRQLSELLSDQETVVANKVPASPVKPTVELTTPARLPTRLTVEPTDTPTVVEVHPVSVIEGTYEDMFQQMSDAIRTEQLFTIPKLGRKELVERFGISSKRISRVFSASGTSVPEFIRECRLEHARQLIVERPDMALNDVAAASGFAHASTFTVDFKNKFGVLPTQYRENIKN